MTPSDDHVRQCWAVCHDGRPAAALAMAGAYHQAAVLAGNAAGAAALSQQIAWFCLQCAEVDRGLDHAKDAGIYWASVGNASREAWCRAMLAWLMLECGIMEEASEAAVAALDLAERCGDPATVCFTANVLGVVFWSCKQLDRALPLLERAVAIARAGEDPVALGWWLINLAGIHSELGYAARLDGDLAGLRREIDLALAINQEAMALLAPETWGLRLSLCNAAEYHLSLKDTDAAEAVLTRCAQLTNGQTPRTKAHYFSTQAQLLIEQARFKDAVDVCSLSLDSAVQSRNTDSEAHALLYMSMAYEGLGEFRSALDHFKRYHEAQLRISADRVQRRARFVEILYETQRFKRLADEAGQAAALASKRADDLARSASTDPLTGLGNRRSLDKLFGELRHQGARYHIAVVDLDRFKSINDRFTHMVGDEVLRRLSAIILDLLPPGDAAIRLGGEEFVMVFRDVEAARALALCCDLNARVAGTCWTEVRPLLAVTASLGVAAWTETDGGPEAVLALADQRVYAAKAAGRDCVVGAQRDVLRRASSGGVEPPASCCRDDATMSKRSAAA